MQALLARPEYTSIRFAADSATLFAGERRILLTGQGITKRGTSVLQADAIAFDDSTCMLRARGSPQLFDQGSVLVADTIRYNTCQRRALVSGALTNFDQNGATWFLRGNLAQDSSSSRLYAVRWQHHQLRPPRSPLSLLGPGSEMDLPDRPGGPARRSVRAGRPRSLAAVHLSGRTAGAALRHSDSPVRDQRYRPAQSGVQPADHEYRLLLGAERVLRRDRTGGLVRQPVCAVRGERPITAGWTGSSPAG